MSDTNQTPTLTRLSLAILRNAAGDDCKHLAAEDLPDRYKLDAQELDAAIYFALNAHCEQHEALVSALDALGKRIIDDNSPICVTPEFELACAVIKLVRGAA